MSAISRAVGGVATALAKKYQKKLAKVMRLTDIVTLALAVFERSVSKVLKDGKIDKWEFNLLQALYYKLFNNLSNVDRKMEAKNISQFEKVYGKKSTT